MITSKASFGCTYCPYKNEIFVGGGYNNGTVIKSVERYSVSEDKWYQLPDFRDAKCSTSLCVAEEGKWLYSIGGLIALDG